MCDEVQGRQKLGRCKHVAILSGNRITEKHARGMCLDANCVPDWIECLWLGYNGRLGGNMALVEVPNCFSQPRPHPHQEKGGLGGVERSRQPCISCDLVGCLLRHLHTISGQQLFSPGHGWPFYPGLDQSVPGNKWEGSMEQHLGRKTKKKNKALPPQRKI